ncbi:MAG: CHAT domain-containing protein, partial [Holophagales bacterium]|nr:CHAT domain-containing protein [Holophagales bacterium]
EAERIVTVTPGAETLLALGADASRALVENGALSAFDVVHFATHGVIDTETPALSGLLLSQRDPAGRPSPGFLHLRDIYQLRFEAELVVLSGCRTALGPVVRGEGLVGLVRGFRYAGARRVLASLWPVEDRATAELMGHFYRALWQEGAPPSRALAEAQRQLAGSRRFRDPYYWSGFVLMGDWRREPGVRRPAE